MKGKAVDPVRTLAQSPGLAQNPTLEGRGRSPSTGVDLITGHVQGRKIDVDPRVHIKNALSLGRGGNQGVVHVHGTREKILEKR